MTDYDRGYMQALLDVLKELNDDHEDDKSIQEFESYLNS